MLTGKQKRYLRSLAHNIDPIFQIGKGGINENMIKQIDDTLENRELIKVHVLQNNFDDKKELDGFNITIPHKERIIPYLDHVDEQAINAGAVNTVLIIR